MPEEKDKVVLEDMTNNIKAGVTGKKLTIEVNLAKPDKGENPEIVAAAVGPVGDNHIQVKVFERGRTVNSK